MASASTANYPDTEAPCFLVPVQVWDGTRFRPDARFVWDTGASFCVVDRRFAEDHRLRLDETADRLIDDMDVVGGSAGGWLTTGVVRFPTLTAGRREPDLKFRMYFLVVDHPQPQPLLGTHGMLTNFTASISWDATVFELRRDHEGTPV